MDFGNSNQPHSIDESKVHDLPISEIFADEEFNCRGVISPIGVMELSKSIKEQGLLQPILVQPWTKKDGKKYRIVMGYRRFKAHQVLNVPTIRAIVKQGLTDDDAVILNLSENIQREDLTILQEAKSIEKLKLNGWSEIQVAERLKKSRGWVQVRFFLLELPVEIQQEAANGNLSQQEIRDAWTTLEHQGLDAAFEYVRELKEAKLTGKKRPVTPAKIAAKKKKNRKYPRTPEEIIEIQGIIREKLGNGIITQLLAWCAGEIDDLTMHQALRAECVKNGKTYMIPLALTQPLHSLVRA